jgi:TolA-binding protein
MKKFYLLALVILSFHALAAGDLASAAPPVGAGRFLQRQQANGLREQQQLNQLQRDQQLNQTQQQLDQLRQRGQTDARPRQEQLNDV